MARPWFPEAKWTSFPNPPSAAPTSCSPASRPMLLACGSRWAASVWDAQTAEIRYVLGRDGGGLALVLVSTFLINHFDLFGLRQVWLFLRGCPYTHLPSRPRDLPARPPPALRRLAHRLLGDADDDRRTWSSPGRPPTSSRRSAGRNATWWNCGQKYADYRRACPYSCPRSPALPVGRPVIRVPILHPIARRQP